MVIELLDVQHSGRATNTFNMVIELLDSNVVIELLLCFPDNYASHRATDSLEIDEGRCRVYLWGMLKLLKATTI